MVALVVKLNGRYLKAIDGFQALEWTRNIRQAMHFNGQGMSYAYQIAETYGAEVVRHTVVTQSQE